MTFTAAAFYRFHPLPRFRELQAPLLAALKELGARGSVLLAEEGVNGTIAATDDAIEAAVDTIRRITGIQALEAKFSPAAEMPFKRMKVRLKKEIVTIGNVPANPNELVGEYVTPQEWNALISDPDVIVLDTRNDYEYRVGTFRKAIDPQIAVFSQFPAWVESHLHNMKGKKIATFCTGGIRCEKATSFMRHAGFEKVYHLKGGILKYLEEVPAEESLWTGACYVFDERVAVGHGLQQADFTTCHGCLMPVSPEERSSPKYEEGVCCPACADTLTEVQKASNRERQRQFELARQRGTRHLGPMEA
ncbi:MAG: rhodanese-related sulfurtransferase [Rhizobiales bacterium]|nr:rhodanese-related sulfurtransferase [Hyphomicrobiales bacterium]